MHLYMGIFIFLFSCTIAILATSPTTVQADALNPDLYSINENPFGASYSTWIARWMNWTHGIPSEEHPRDFAERTCNVSQTWKDVWFLPDILAGNIVRQCEVPFGKAIFVPITVGWQSQAESEEFQGRPVEEIEDELIKNAFYCNDHNVERAVEIDGQKIQGLEGSNPYRTNTTGLINLSYGENNIYEVKGPIVSPAFAEGWFLFVKPLPEGDHTIKIHSKIANPTDVSCDYEGNTEWNIQIK
jgi:hypothetical protein